MATQLRKERLVIDEKVRDQVVEHLQSCLFALIDLSLQAKQAHWNLVGPNFRSFHLQLDDIVDLARDAADDVAERIATLGTAADGRADSVASGTSLSSFPDGRVAVEQAVDLMADRLAGAIRTLRQALEPMGDLDGVTEDLLLGISGGMEKQLWMVQVQQAE